MKESESKRKRITGKIRRFFFIFEDINSEDKTRKSEEKCKPSIFAVIIN